MSLLELVGSILTELEKVQEKLDRILASGGEKEGASRDAGRAELKDSDSTDSKLPEVRIHSPGFDDYKPEATIESVKKEFKEFVDNKKENKEEVDMDFSQVTVMNQTPLALLVVKQGKQQWLARQFIKNPLKEYFVPNVYDIVLKEKSDKGKPIGWITKKWEDFEVFKG